MSHIQGDTVAGGPHAEPLDQVLIVSSKESPSVSARRVERGVGRGESREGGPRLGLLFSSCPGGTGYRLPQLVTTAALVVGKGISPAVIPAFLQGKGQTHSHSL